MASVRRAYCDFTGTAEGTEVYRQFKRLLYGSDDSLSQWLSKDVLGILPNLDGQLVAVCDIGGGDGDRAIRVLRSLRARYHNMYRLDLVEQSAVYASGFAPADMTYCESYVHASRFEDVALQQQSYDLVLLVHSIFAFANGSSTEKVLSLRKPTGSVVIVSNAPNSFLGGLKRLMDSHYSDHRFEIDELEADLVRRGVRFTKSTTMTEWAMAVSPSSADFSTMLTWLSLGRFNSFPDEKQSEITDYIKHHCRTDGSRSRFREEEVVLVLQ